MTHPWPAVSLVVLVISGCSGSSGTETPLVRNTSLRIVGNRTGGGAADALAAAVLLATDLPAPRPGRATLAMTNSALRQKLLDMSWTHLVESGFLESAGAGMAGSAYIRRLAAAPGAPPDFDGDGSNLDDTLTLHYSELTALAGIDLPPGLRPILFPWQDGVADLATAGDPTLPFQKTIDGQVGQVQMAQVGHAMLARIVLAGGLLKNSRGSRPGATAVDGMVGLLLMQQVIAMEETLVASLFMQDPALGGLTFPADYDPAKGLRWLPKGFRGIDDPKLPSIVASYGIDDRAGTLETLAVVLRASAELSFLASDKNPNANLRDLFRGNPFGKKPGGGGGGDAELVTWESGVGTLLAGKCAVCHTLSPPQGGLLVNTPEQAHRGGTNSGAGSSTPIIVRGDATNSLLYNILLKKEDRPAAFRSFQRMPQFGPFLVGEDLQLIKDWIDDGARSAPPGPPRIGVDLAQVAFKNLIALHLHESGALHVRHEGDAPVEFADAAATGATLHALAALMHMSGDIRDLEKTLQKIADFAVDNLTSANGEVFRGYDIAANLVEGTADLIAHARMTAGLLAASRVLSSPALTTRATALAERLLSTFFNAGKSLFQAEPGQPGIRYTPDVLAAVIDALREMATAGIDGAVETHEKFLARLIQVLVFSEIGGDEVLGDGIADTDGNGIPEPALAGGEFGRAPVFVGEIREGPDPVGTSGPITWSKDIQPLLRNTCAVCHMDGAVRGGYRVDTPALLRKAGSASPPLPILVPFDPEGSLLYRKLVDRNPPIGVQMPQDTPPLGAHGKALVRQWILDGASSR